MDWFEAAATDDMGRVAELLAQGADVDAKGTLGRTALSLASASGHLRVIDACLRSGADPNLTDSAGVTALMLAAHNDQYEVVRALLEGGADPRRRDVTGHDAVWYGMHREIDFTLSYPRRFHATIFVRRLFTTKSVRLIRQALVGRW